MKIKVLAILTVTAMCVSLCSCGGQIETNSRGKDVELGASPSSEPATSSASETVTVGKWYWHDSEKSRWRV